MDIIQNLEALREELEEEPDQDEVREEEKSDIILKINELIGLLITYGNQE